MKYLPHIATVLILSAQIAAAKLSIGDPAPPLQTGKWVQGDPVKAFDTNHVYIMEFWATWCGPCRASIPYLNELSQKLKTNGVVTIAQDVWEDNDGGVPDFVKSMGTNMTYRVALDDKTTDPKGAMAENWMDAAERNGIPTAFVVDRHGRIAWIGHPMALDETTLDQIVADKFDIAAFAKQYQQEQAAQMQRMALSQQLQEAVGAKDWKTAEATLDEADKTFPEETNHTAILRVNLLLAQTNFAAAGQLAEKTAKASPTNVMVLNGLAWLLAASDGVDQHGRQLAETFAGRANKITGGKNPAVLDTLARAQFVNGKTKQAVATEQQALAQAPAAAQEYFKKQLASYQAGKLPEE